MLINKSKLVTLVCAGCLLMSCASDAAARQVASKANKPIVSSVPVAVAKPAKPATVTKRVTVSRGATVPRVVATAKPEQPAKAASKAAEQPLPKKYQRIKILGEATASKEQAAALLILTNKDPRLACSANQIVEYYWQEATSEGVRPDLALAQALVETGFFAYGGEVVPEQNNFCGLGTTGKGVRGAAFETPQIGVRAHIQHLLAYCTKREPKQTIVDPRYKLAHNIRLKYGLCEHWYQLNGIWAKSANYSEKIMRVHQSMLAVTKDDLQRAKSLLKEQQERQQQKQALLEVQLKRQQEQLQKQKRKQDERKEQTIVKQHSVRERVEQILNEKKKV